MTDADELEPHQSSELVLACHVLVLAILDELTLNNRSEHRTEQNRTYDKEQRTKKSAVRTRACFCFELSLPMIDLKMPCSIAFTQLTRS